MSERDFHVAADEALEDIHDAVEAALEAGFEDDFDCNISVGRYRYFSYCCSNASVYYTMI